MSSVLFVCLGNICRSPMAEGLFRFKLAERGIEGIEVDSAGTAAYHEGEPPDPRTREVLSRHGIHYPMTARQVRDADFDRYEYILAMDRANLADLQSRCPASLSDRLHLVLHGEAGAGESDVPDPYYGGPQGFERVFGMLDTALDGWLDRVLDRTDGAGRATPR